MGDDQARRDRIEHLKYALERLEGRIQLVDNKATTLLGIQAGILAFLTFAAPLVVARIANPVWRWIAVAFFALDFVAMLLVLFLLTLVIRPSRLKRSTLAAGGAFPTLGVLWPSRPDRQRLRSGQALDPPYAERVSRLNLEEIEKELASSCFVTAGLNAEKYHWYPIAALVIKYLIIGNAVAVAIGGSIVLGSM